MKRSYPKLRVFKGKDMAALRIKNREWSLNKRNHWWLTGDAFLWTMVTKREADYSKNELLKALCTSIPVIPSTEAAEIQEAVKRVKGKPWELCCGSLTACHSNINSGPATARAKESSAQGPKAAVPLSFTSLSFLKKTTAPALQDKTQAVKLMEMVTTAFPHPSELNTKHPQVPPPQSFSKTQIDCHVDLAIILTPWLRN